MNSSKAGQTVSLTQVRQDVNALLEEYYIQQQQTAYMVDPMYGRLWGALLEVHRSGGKRLRPYIMILSYVGLGGQNYAGALRVAAALELLHSSMLIHDDIIDRDYTRHGAANVAGKYLEHYASAAHRAEHYANSSALLAGDVALSGAYQLVLGAGLSDSQKITAGQMLGHVLFTVAGGELLDAEATLGPLESADSLKIALLKTASYSFVGPLHIGATLAGAGGETLDALKNYGEALGIAYQLADDMLGLFGDEAVTGKSVTSDIEEGRPTFLIQRALALVNQTDKDILSGLLQRGSVTHGQADQFRQIVQTSGAVEEVKRLMQTYAGQSQAVLAGITLSDSVKEAFEALAVAAVKRHL